MKTALLFGGSFNPPHDGHFDTAAHAFSCLKTDEVWVLFSVNRLKNPAQYESLDHRMEMGRILARHYPHVPFVMSDIERHMKTHETYFVLKELQKRFPDRQFIWVMGSDNLNGFEKWSHADEIFREFRIMIIQRAGYGDTMRDTPILRKFSSLERSAPDDLKSGAPGWVTICSIKQKDLAISSTELRERLRRGETYFRGHFREVAAYIRQHGLYGTKPSLPTPGP